MAAHSPFRNAAVEAALWAVWRAASGVRAVLVPVARVVRRFVRATSQMRAVLQRALIRVELALADVLTDGAGRIRERIPFLVLVILAAGNAGWLALR